jgi:hypothetical protein
MLDAIGAAFSSAEGLIIIKNQYRIVVIGNTSLTGSECQQFIHGRHFSPPMTHLTLIYTNN